MTASSTRCGFCGHKRIAHTDDGKEQKFFSGACYGSGGVCRCLRFEDDMTDDQVEAVASSEADISGKTIDAADRILMMDQNDKKFPDGVYTQGTTETLTKDQLDINRISINTMTPNGQDVQDGDIWTPSPGMILIRFEGQWLEPDVFREIISTRKEAAHTDEVPADDPVNHPSHYTAYPGIEVIQLTRWMTFNCGNAVKYVARAGLKDPEKEIQDLEKAIWYLQDEIKLKKGEYGTPGA